MVLEVLVDVQGVEVLRVEAGEQHVDDDGDVDLVRVGQVAVGVLLVLDAVLHVLVVGIELAELVVGAVAGVVVGDDGLQRGLFVCRVLLVVGLFLRQVFLQLLDVAVALGWRREDAGDVERAEAGRRTLAFRLHLLEQRVVGDGIVDGGGGQQSVEAALVGGGVVLVEDGIHHGALAEVARGFRAGLGLGVVGVGRGWAGVEVGRVGRGGIGGRLALGPEVVDVEAQDVAIVDGVGDGVGVQLLLEDVLGGGVGADGAVHLDVAGVLLEDGRAGKAEQLRPGENALMAWWLSPNWERWHSSKMITRRLSRRGASRSL